MKQIVKTESVAEFMARGGKVTKVTPKGPKKTYKKTVDDACFDEEVDWDSIPMALRIKFGIR